MLRRSRELYAQNKERYGSPRMSRKGDCWDNAPMEPFFKMMEVELIYPKKQYHARQEAAASIFE